MIDARGRGRGRAGCRACGSEHGRGCGRARG
jgi:hypothetical protein